MGFKDLLKKVEASSEYAEMIEKYPDAELVAGFFIRDFVSNDNKESIDYKVGGEKVLTFNLKLDENGDDSEEKIVVHEDKLIDDAGRPSLVRIDKEINIEVDELKNIVGTRALDEGISAKFSKIIAVLQKYDNKQIWNLTCMLEGLIILNIHVDALSGDVLKFERKSMMDLIKKK